MLSMRLAVVALTATLVAAPASAGPHAQRLKATAAHVDGVVREVMKSPSAPPGLALVLTARGEAPVILTYGVRNAATRAPVTAETPLYIASQTKAYVGTLAAQLDREGVLDLDAPLASAWPRLSGDVGQVRFRQWMSHVAPFEVPALEFRTSYVGAVPEPTFGRLLAEDSRPRNPGFGYANAGYLVWRAALEAKGDRLETLMARRVFRPLGLTRTSMLTSDFPDRDLAFGHVRSDAGWVAVPPKPDTLMHAAGGMVSSPADVGRWLLVNLDPARAGPLAQAVRETQAQQAAYTGDRRGFTCDGYGIGWHRCAYRGERILSHGGNYTGFGSLATVAPDAGFGVAVLGNADSAGLTFTSDVTKVALDAWAGRPPAPGAAKAMAAFLDSLAVRSTDAVARRRAEPVFGGWAWKPGPPALAAYAGRYASPRLGEVAVSATAGGLRARLGAFALALQPAAPDVFGGFSPADRRPEVIRFERGAEGRVTALVWDDRRFERR